MKNGNGFIGEKWPHGRRYSWHSTFNLFAFGYMPPPVWCLTVHFAIFVWSHRRGSHRRPSTKRLIYWHRFVCAFLTKRMTVCAAFLRDFTRRRQDDARPELIYELQVNRQWTGRIYAWQYSHSKRPHDGTFNRIGACPWQTVRRGQFECESNAAINSCRFFLCGEVVPLSSSRWCCIAAANVITGARKKMWLEKAILCGEKWNGARRPKENQQRHEEKCYALKRKKPESA